MTAPRWSPKEALEWLREWGSMAAGRMTQREYVRRWPSIPVEEAIAALETLLSEHEAVKAKLAAYEAKVPSAFDIVNDAYPFAIAIRDERVGRTLSTPASGVPSLRSAMKDAFRVITGEPLVVEAKEPAAAVPSDEEITSALRRWRFHGSVVGRLECMQDAILFILQRIGVKL